MRLFLGAIFGIVSALWACGGGTAPGPRETASAAEVLGGETSNGSEDLGPNDFPVREFPEDLESRRETSDLVEEEPEVRQDDLAVTDEPPPEQASDEPSWPDGAFGDEIWIEEYVDAQESLDPPGDALGPPAEDFAVDVGDPEGFAIHGTIWASASGGPAPLVVLVHGLGCHRWTWTQHFHLVQVLVTRGFAVAAYDQRAHGESRHLALDLPEMARDIGRVILHLDARYGPGGKGWVATDRPVGLVGHSLGAYMVTIASCQDLGFLGEATARLGVTIEGAGPDNLQEVKEFLDTTKGFNYLVNMFVVALTAHQAVGEPSQWWVQWTSDPFGATDEVLEALYLAPNPIERGHGNGVSTLDHADFILTPFFVVHSLKDDVVPGLVPLTCPSDLYNDVTYNSGGPLGTWLVVNPSTGYHTWSLVGHDIFLDPAAVDWTVARLEQFLLGGPGR